ncbi:type IV secretory system conjugative DNA transfer family protein [Enterococcus faecalis]|nr:type IV secretory system conjugative DNA transfer family protein [Enterococcus faecalis]EKB7620518.1 type IV secretory system conjugative DNA transfer family protein [Enterococcus faecalis]HBI1794877.1 type IV secretory system conjugative DNA transfer family protein [Enterococcus faecalis]
MNKKYKQWKKLLAHPAVITLVAIVSFLLILLLLNLVSKVLFVLLQTLVSLKHQGASSDPGLLKELPKKILSYVQSTSPFQFAPVLGKVSFLSTLLVILVWLLFMPKKLYQMRIAFRDINKGTKGVARWTTFKEMIQQYPIVALDHKEYEGESGVPVLHFNLNPFRYFFWKIKGFNLPYCKNGYVFIDRNKTNSWVDAGTQSGKTEMWSYPTLDLIMRAGVKDSVIVTDLKGNMIKNTKEEFEKFGFDVFCLNLVQPSYSIGYNPLELIKNAYWEGDYDSAQLLCNTFSYSIFHNDKSNADPMWEEASIALVNALILAVCFICKENDTPEKVTMYTVAVMLSELGQDPDENGMTALDAFFSDLEPTNPAKLQFATIKFSQGITRSGIYTGTMAKLKSFTFDSIGRLTATSDLDFENLVFGDKPVALFIVYPDYDDSNYMLISTFISQANYVLAKSATLSKESTLPRKVKHLFEEAANIPPIHGLGRHMNVGLERGMVYYLITQSVVQLEERYGDKAARTLINACGNKYYIMGDGEDDAKYFCNMLGTTTVIAASRHGDPLSMDKSYGESEDGRELLKEEELRMLKPGEWVVYRTKMRRDLKGNGVNPRPILASEAEGTKMLHRHEYLKPRFDHSMTFEELHQNTSKHAELHMKDLIINFKIDTVDLEDTGEYTKDPQELQETREVDDMDLYPEVLSDEKMSPEEVSTLLESIEEVHENLTLLTDYFSEDQLALMRSIVQRSVDEDQYDYFASLQHVELVENWLENFQIPEVQELFYGVLKG